VPVADDRSTFRRRHFTEALAVEAARQAILQLRAINRPGRANGVGTGPGWPGILLHEAIGHGLEADFNRKALQRLPVLVGQKVASELCTVVDDGTIRSGAARSTFDDEGNPNPRDSAHREGHSYRLSARQTELEIDEDAVTGNGRRQGFDHIPLPRMTNTFMMAGESDPQDIISLSAKVCTPVHFGGDRSTSRAASSCFPPAKRI
jgi:TldD protein